MPTLSQTVSARGKRAIVHGQMVDETRVVNAIAAHRQRERRIGRALARK
jgi:hypothetical protein